MKHQSLINVHHLPTKENKIPTFVSICTSKQMEVCRFRFPFVCCNQNIFIHICIYICCCFKRKTEAQGIFLNPFTICSSCKQKFVICPFVDKKMNGRSLFANGLNGFAHLCFGKSNKYSSVNRDEWHGWIDLKQWETTPEVKNKIRCWDFLSKYRSSETF
jgi:hypothetical protein